MRRYRRIVLVACALAFLAVLVHTTVAFGARSELTQPEGIIATQTLSFAREGSLYYDLQQYPYTVCAYMPVFYTLVAGLYQIGVPVLAGGRLISLLALVAVLYLVWKILFLYTEEKLCAWTGVALAGQTQLLLGWGMAGQVDMLAVALTLASFYRMGQQFRDVLLQAIVGRDANGLHVVFYSRRNIDNFRGLFYGEFRACSG